ncbi:hypothetical protein C1N53_02630 [Pontibacter sp. SGAir0037]|nr:hypothetical protein C1N53_02630 [Pontibacter sp. SGAir0037]
MYTTLTISHIQEEIEGFKTFTFEGEGAAEIAYKAGQYLTFVYQDHAEELRRSYSITSSPSLNEPLRIGVKRIENGVFSRYLIDYAKVGDRVQTSGAGGFFTLPDDLSAVQQIFFFAAGSGITPVLSLIKTLLHDYTEIQVVLIYSNSSPATTIYLEVLQQLEASSLGRLKIEFLFSNSPDLARARLYRDLLQELVKQYATVPLKHALFYLCGPQLYMTMCNYGIRQLGVAAGSIIRENFSTVKVPVKVEPQDKGPHTVLIRAGERELSLAVQYPTTILQAARQAGLTLPYSCEAGKCGNCVARCTEGKVWMSYNEVLTEKALAKGLVLTCVGHPIEGNVTIEL